MNIRKCTYWFLTGILVFSILGCATASPTDAEPTQTPESNTSVETPATEAPTVAAPTDPPPATLHACDNPYLPIVTGARWVYKLTGPIPDTFTHTIVTLESNGFTEQDVFDSGVTRQGKWQCDNGNLIALNPTSGNSANVSAEGISVDFETKDLSGVTLPAVINVGDTWAQSLTLEGTQTINGTAYPSSTKFTSICKAEGVESVTVEAGNFSALRVECQTDMNISLALDANNPTTTTLSLTGINWYAENIGLVKSSTSGMGLDSTVELTNFNIPF